MDPRTKLDTPSGCFIASFDCGLRAVLAMVEDPKMPDGIAACDNALLLTVGTMRSTSVSIYASMPGAVRGDVAAVLLGRLDNGGIKPKRFAQLDAFIDKELRVQAWPDEQYTGLHALWGAYEGLLDYLGERAPLCPHLSPEGYRDETEDDGPVPDWAAFQWKDDA